MKKMDKNGLLLCDIQGKIFEKSIISEQCSSNIFIRRYMNSEFCHRMDQDFYLNQSNSFEQAFEEINDEYGKSTYGKVMFSKDELYWIGYIYRYFSYTQQMDSKKIYKLFKGTDLRTVYYPYHSLDPMQAIERLLESKKIYLPKNTKDITNLGVTILRDIKKKYSK